jgi:hypothetical protein
LGTIVYIPSMKLASLIIPSFNLCGDINMGGFEIIIGYSHYLGP